MNNDKNDSSKGSAKDSSKSSGEASDGSDIGGAQGCLWGIEPYKHGDKVCDTTIGRKKRCNNGVWEDTDEEC